jgi:hypothetical protein
MANRNFSYLHGSCRQVGQVWLKTVWAGLATIIGSVASAEMAQAANYYLPYPSGKIYTVTQSWESDSSHSDDFNRYAVDFGMSVGQDVAAVAPGTVIRSSRGKVTTNIGGCDISYDKYARYVVIDHGNNESSLYLHLSEESVSEGDTVTQGQVIGKSGATGYVCGSNGSNGAHLHFTFQKTDTMGSSRYGTSTRIGFSETNGEKPIKESSYISKNSSARIGIFDSNNQLFVKEGSLHALWVNEYNGVKSYFLSGNRIAVLTSSGEVLVKEGDLHAPWVNEYKGAKSVVLSGNRIAVLTSSGEVLVKEGDLHAPWINEYKGAKSVVLSGNRIGILTSSGEALVKEGSLHAPWVTEYKIVIPYTGATAIALSGDRIAILTSSGEALVKEGSLHAPWVNEYADATTIALSGNRIGILTSSGEALVKEGSIHAPWITEYFKSRSLQLSMP